MQRTLRISVIAMAILGVLACACGPAVADGITNSGDDGRTGWYPNAGISPQVVTGGTFGQLWSANVAGQVYAQPLVAANSDGSAKSVIVTTEQNNVYALDPTAGTQQWATNLGTPWSPADIGCADIQPYRGSTATPVIDTSNNTVYLTYKTYSGTGQAEWFMGALNIDTGAEQPGFPVQLSGTADDFPSLTFDAQTEEQRPGLLLMDGVVYAAFGGNCDRTPWQGWIFGVAAGTGQITARWADNPGGDGAGIWQSGVGVTSDGPGTLLFVTGNGGSPTVPASSSSMPDSFGESVVRLHVGSNGQLTPVDFFTPFDATTLDGWDADFGAGALVALPPAEFGTPSLPDLGVTVGKEGYVYLLNLANLGGFEQGTGGGDNVVQRLGPFGGVWGRAGVWPGDGGYLYIPTSTGTSTGGQLDVYKYGLTGAGAPSLAADGTASGVFGWGSGSPVITSAGTNSGTALVWIIWSADRTGAGAQLRAYDPLPVSGTLQQVYSAPIGTSANYSMPGVGDNGQLYVGTRSGTVLAFGSPVTQPVTGQSLSFPATPTGTSSTPQTLTLTVYEAGQVTSVSSSSPQFVVGTPSPTLPGTFAGGDTISVPVTFAPTQVGPVGANITVTTDQGNVSIPVSGTGELSSPHLVAEQTGLSLGGTTVGSMLSGTVTFANNGNAPLTINSVLLPSAPFAAVGAPPAGSVLDPNQSVTIEIDFNPTTVGQFTDAIELDSTGGNASIGVSGSAATPPSLQITSETNDLGNVEVGSTATATFTLTNTGGSSLTINKSKPPFGGEFTALSSLQEGTTVAPGGSLTETIQFAPTTAGPASGEWDITGNDASGLQKVEFTGNGVLPPMLQITSETNDFGAVQLGTTVTKTFTLTNTGGSDLTIDSSTPPSGEFRAVSSLASGTTVSPGQSVTETVSFTPNAVGAASGEWDITGNDSSGRHQVAFTGTGVAPPPVTTTTTTTTATTTTTTTTTSATRTSTTPTGGTAKPALTAPTAPTIGPSARLKATSTRSYISYTAVVRRSSHFTLERAVIGRSSGGKCVGLTRRNRHLSACTRWMAIATFAHADKSGVNQLWLVDVMPGNRLIVGSYRLLSTLDDARGRPHSFVTYFRIK